MMDPTKWTDLIENLNAKVKSHPDVVTRGILVVIGDVMNELAKEVSVAHERVDALSADTIPVTIAPEETTAAIDAEAQARAEARIAEHVEASAPDPIVAAFAADPNTAPPPPAEAPKAVL